MPADHGSRRVLWVGWEVLDEDVRGIFLGQGDTCWRHCMGILQLE